MYVADSSALKGKAVIELNTILPGVNKGSKLKLKKFSCCITIFVTSVTELYLTIFTLHPWDYPFKGMSEGFFTPVTLT